MTGRGGWQPHTRDLDGALSYVREPELLPDVVSGRAWLPNQAWTRWIESCRITLPEYAQAQHEKEAAVAAITLGREQHLEWLPPSWPSGLKLHAALPNRA